MITVQEARAIAETWLATLSTRIGIELAIDDTATREEPWCWLFCYNSAVYLETGSFSHALAGNGPLLVEKKGGRLHELVAARPVEDQLAELRNP